MCIQSDVQRQKYIKEHPLGSKSNKTNNATTSSEERKVMFDDDDSSLDSFEISDNTFDVKTDEADNERAASETEKQDKPADPFACTDCSKKFKSLSSFTSHCRKVHKNEPKAVSSTKNANQNRLLRKLNVKLQNQCFQST